MSLISSSLFDILELGIFAVEVGLRFMSTVTVQGTG